MANPPNTFTDSSTWKAALEALQANDMEIFSRMDALNASNTQWLANSFTPSYVSTTQFTINGDVTEQFTAGRVIRAQITGGYFYSPIESASYDALTDKTTVTLVSTILDNTLSQVNLGILTPGEESALPNDVLRAFAENTITGSLSLPVPQAANQAIRMQEIAGMITGLAPIYKNASEVSISAGQIEISGKVYTLAASLDKAQSIGADAKGYIYVEAPTTGTTLSAAEISISTTAPIEQADGSGWYRDTKRCIGALLTDGSGNIRKFVIAGSWWLPTDGDFSFYSSSSVVSVWTLVATGVPSFGKVAVLVHSYASGSSNTDDVRLTSGDGGDSSANTHTWAGRPYTYIPQAGTQRGSADSILTTDSAGRIKVTHPENANLFLAGFALPKGLATR